MADGRLSVLIRHFFRGINIRPAKHGGGWDGRMGGGEGGEQTSLLGSCGHLG